MKQILYSQYITIVQFTTHHLVVVVVIATTGYISCLLQAGQQSGLPLDAVAHNSGGASQATAFSCDDDVVSVGHLDSTS